jgi:serine protease Do
LNNTNDSGMARITDKPPKDYPGAEDGKWPFLPLGTSADLKKGQWIVSMGHPGGPKTDRPPPVRTGRFVELDKANRWRRSDLLKTDATLVGGDSGGPLFDLDTKVIGIHSQIENTLDVNLHVPLEKFQAEWDRLARGDVIYRTKSEQERNTKVDLGVKYDEKTAATTAKIEEIVANGAAEKAGLDAGDVILSFNGNKVKAVEDLKQMLPSYRVGEKVKVEVDRGGNTVTVDLKLVEKSKE